MGSDNITIDEIVKLLQMSNTFCLVTHDSPDGDGIGCMAALNEMLLSKGKQVDMIFQTKVSENFAPIIGKKNVNKIIIPTDNKIYDVCILLDVADYDRTYYDIKNISKKILIIDHHILTNVKISNKVYYLNNEDACTGITLLPILKNMGEITKKMATALYLTIKSDTDDFKNENINKKAFDSAGELIEYGADIDIVNDIYNINTESYLKLLSLVLGNIKIDKENKIVSLIIRKTDISEAKSNMKEAGFIIDILKTMNLIDMSFLFIEGNNQVIIRARSKNKNIATVLQHFGGGGHKNSAGCLLTSDDIYKTRDKVLQYAILNF